MTVPCCPVRKQSHPSCDPEDVTSRQQVKARHGQHQNDPTKTEAWTPSLTEVSLTPPSTKSKHVAVVVVKSYLLLRRRHPETMHASTKPRLARPPEIEHQSHLRRHVNTTPNTSGNTSLYHLLGNSPLTSRQDHKPLVENRTPTSRSKVRRSRHRPRGCRGLYQSRTGIARAGCGAIS